MKFRKLLILSSFILLTCSSYKKTVNNSCTYDNSKYDLINQLSNYEHLEDYILHENIFSIESHKELVFVQEEIMLFFEITKEEYFELDFTKKGDWCAKSLSDIRTTKNKSKQKVLFLSYPILSDNENKAFIISIRDEGMQTILLVEKSTEDWFVSNEVLLSF
jgi:hypothetical protein